MFCIDIPEPVDPQICQAMCTIMKLSFEEEYRRAMNELGWWNTLGFFFSTSSHIPLMASCSLPGGLQVTADLIHLDQELYGLQSDPINMALRRYAGMAMTNLTFGDVVNKVKRRSWGEQYDGLINLIDPIMEMKKKRNNVSSAAPLVDYYNVFDITQ